MFTLVRILFLMIFCLYQTSAYSQKERIEYLDDISDLVATSGKGFQLQIGTGITWSREGNTRNYQYNIPYVVTRYAFNDRLGIQGEIGLDINRVETDGEQSTSQTQVSDIIIGSVYEFNPDLKLAIFSQFSLNWDNIIPMNDNDYFYSELDLNSSTTLSDRAELDYSVGFGYQVHGANVGVYSLELDYYLTPKILAGISNDGQWNWTGFKKSFRHWIEFELSFLSKKNRQLNLTFIKGINNNFNFSGITFIQNL